MDPDGSFTCVRASLSRLLDINQNSKKDYREKISLELMRLGAAYSDIRWLDTAELVYGVAAPRLEVFDDRSHAFERACTFRDFARYYEMRGSPEDHVKQLKLAFRCIEAARLYDAKQWHQRQDNCDPWFPPCRIYYHMSDPMEAHFESVAQEDPQLSLWILGKPFESAI
ncbi:hypothetical protein N431DRAFT_464596 [Stipitochalara longipes BDJ]|nr:hypothetical protein N431DRAFT_464596 [Stipitochalara longipes BDJ]